MATWSPRVRKIWGLIWGEYENPFNFDAPPATCIHIKPSVSSQSVKASFSSIAIASEFRSIKITSLVSSQIVKDAGNSQSIQVREC